MSEQEQTSQLSALFDGELPSQQADLVIRRASRDQVMRERWQRYALIGACVRGEPLAGTGANSATCLADRVSARIASEAEILAPWSVGAGAGPGAGRGMAQFFGRGAMGGAIAAGVAVMAVFVVRSIGLVDDTAGTGEMVAQGEPVATSQVVDSEPRSYTTPGENSAPPRLLPNHAPLVQYVVAHSERAASYLGVSYDLTEGAVVMTEDEIAARLR
jgi:negative regulator of sigma E activity